MLTALLLTAWGLGLASGALLLVDPRVTSGFLHAGPQPQDHGGPVGRGLKNPTLCDPNVKQYSGYLDVSLAKSYFFWMFESRSDPGKDPLVVWLTGGPGCSSQLALLAENGPCTPTKDGNGTVPNPYSWTEKANVLWVDQPAGTGFSTGLLHPDFTEKDVADDMYRFLQNFYRTLPQFKSNPQFICGESYAGHYVPAVAHRIWAGAKRQEGFPMPLRGIGVGNGLVDPEVQYQWYPDMARDGGRTEGGTLAKGVITSPLAIALMKAAVVPCVTMIDLCNQGGPNASMFCTAAYVTCNYGELIPYQATGMNPYDMRIKCEHGNLCYDFDHVTKFLNDKAVQKQLGVNKQWASCNMLVHALLQGDWMKRYQDQLPALLADGIRVLIYAGDVDYICNWLGNKHWATALQWPHRAEFASAPDAPFLVDGAAAGRVRQAAGLSFLQVFQAGHMVPMDKPAVALEMLNRFLADRL
jgi:carboxypeptidase C (cathepsin A)